MAKNFNQWLDEFVDNGADAKDVTNWPENGGGGQGGGMVIVDTLPDVGDPTLLYKLPDGTIWSCVNKTETRTICDLKVGQSYKLVESITFDELQNIYENVIGNYVGFVENQEYPEIQAETDAMTGNKTYAYRINGNDSAYYYIDYEHTSEAIELQFTGSITTSPNVEITQYFVNNLQTEATLEDLIPLFQNSSHEETVTISTWTKVNGGGSDLGLIYPNTKLQQLDDALVIGDFETHSGEYTYIKLSDLMSLLEEKVDLSTIPLDTENNTNALHIRLLTSFANFRDSANINSSIAEICFYYREDSTSHYLIIQVMEPLYGGIDIFDEETEISFEPSGHTFKDLLEYYIATIGDTKIILSRYDSSLQIKFTRGLEPAICQPFFTCLAFNKEIYDGETKEVFLAHLDMDSFISKIHKEE